jgi:hypothetical protein
MTSKFRDGIQDECDWQQTEIFLCSFLVIITWKTWVVSTVNLMLKTFDDFDI